MNSVVPFIVKLLLPSNKLSAEGDGSGTGVGSGVGVGSGRGVGSSRVSSSLTSD